MRWTRMNRRGDEIYEERRLLQFVHIRHALWGISPRPAYAAPSSGCENEFTQTIIAHWERYIIRKRSKACNRFDFRIVYFLLQHKFKVVSEKNQGAVIFVLYVHNSHHIVKYMQLNFNRKQSVVNRERRME